MAIERVLVKGFMGVALNRWLVGTRRNLADITNEDGAKAIESGREPLFVLGFPKNDVFRPISEEIPDGTTPDWTHLPPRF